MPKVEVYSADAGIKISFELDNNEVEPSEALAHLFVAAIRALLAKHGWQGMPPLDVATAWSIASLAAHGVDLADDKDMFKECLGQALVEFYGMEFGNSEEVHKA